MGGGGIIPPLLSSPLFSLPVSSGARRHPPPTFRLLRPHRERAGIVIYGVIPRLGCVCLFDSVRAVDCTCELRLTRVYFKAAEFIFIWVFFCDSLD